MISKNPVLYFMERWADLLHEEEVDAIMHEDGYLFLTLPAGTDVYPLPVRNKRIFDIMRQIGFSFNFNEGRDIHVPSAERSHLPNIYSCYISITQFKRVYQDRACAVAKQWSHKLNDAIHWQGLPLKESHEFTEAMMSLLRIRVYPAWGNYIPGLTNPVPLLKLLPEFVELRERLGSLPSWGTIPSNENLVCYATTINLREHPDMISPY